MKAESRDQRRDEIMDRAVEVLAERGYRDTSMLEVARRTAASKQTLYAWFGDKQGLFAAIIRRNAQGVQQGLEEQLDSSATTESVLEAFGEALLTLLLGDGAIAINRAAIAEARSDPSLAHTLASAGRKATLPVFIDFLEQCQACGDLVLDSPSEAAEDFLGLLLGDLQTRRLLGVLPAPSRVEIEARADRATRLFLQLYRT